MNLIIKLGFTILFFLTVNLQAQVFSFGLKGGLNYSNVTDDFSLPTDYRTGINIGVFANLNFTKNVGIISEFNYEQKGFKYSLASGIQQEYIKGEKSFQYFTVPILFKYQFGRSTRFYITIGSYMGILLAANDKGLYEDYTTTPNTITAWDDNIYRDTQDVDIGLCFGAGLQIPINYKFGLLLDGRYNSGLMLLEPDKIYVEEYKNVSLNLSFGLVYHLAY